MLAYRTCAPAAWSAGQRTGAHTRKSPLHWLTARVTMASTAGPRSIQSKATPDQMAQDIKDQAVAPLFTPFKLGPHQLSNRMVLAPMTRCRATLENVPLPHMATYYGQRITPGTLFITEGTYINDESVGYCRAPGVWTAEQVEAWKPVTKAVTDKGGIFINQIFHCGRASHPAMQPNAALPPAPSAIGIPPPAHCYLPDWTTADYPVPRELDTAGIKQVVADFVASARNSIAAGFNGVELHSANGYLLEQFIKTSSNKRTDEYGGSVENRCRLVIEVATAVAGAIGADKVGIRLSPFHDILACKEDDPLTTYTYLLEQLNKLNLLYVHLEQPDGKSGEKPSLTPLRKVVTNSAVIYANGYNAHTGAKDVASGEADLIAFGRAWLANPDLQTRFKLGAKLNQPDYTKLYTPGMDGYLDYPTLEEDSTKA